MMMRTAGAAALGLAALLVACSRQEQPQPAASAEDRTQIMEIRTAEAASRNVDRTTSVTGSLIPDETVTVSSEVAGRVLEIHTDFGQTVRRGDVIAELDKREFTIQLERAQASLAQALARVGLDPAQEDVVPELTPAIRQVTAQLEDARFKYENAAKLVESGDISRERYIELEKALQARQAALDSAKDELRTQLATIRALRAEVRLAQKRLTDATVRAPFEGAVAERMVSPGQYLRENTPIISLVKTSPLRLRLDVSEAIAGELRIGTSLTFTTDAAPGAEFHAVVRELNPALNVRNRSLTAEARLVESDPRLRPGMFVQVRLVVQRGVTVVMVPAEALYSIAGLTKLFAIRDGKAVELRVLPAARRDGWVEITDNLLRPGETVAISRLDALVDGTAVKITRPSQN